MIELTYSNVVVWAVAGVFIASSLGFILDWIREKNRRRVNTVTSTSVGEVSWEIAISDKDSYLIQAAIDGAVRLQKNGEYDKAIAKWLAIGEVTENKEIQAKAFFSGACLTQEYDASYKRNDKDTIKKVISLYDDGIEFEPDPKAFCGRGLAKYNLGQYEAAIADYDKAIALEPDYAEAFYNRGFAKDNLRQYASAITDFNKAITLKPDYPEAFASLEFARRELERSKGSGSLDPAR